MVVIFIDWFFNVNFFLFVFICGGVIINFRGGFDFFFLGVGGGLGFGTGVLLGGV